MLIIRALVFRSTAEASNMSRGLYNRVLEVLTSASAENAEAWRPLPLLCFTCEEEFGVDGWQGRCRCPMERDSARPLRC